jgi:chemotaxis protein histidine kinase CheA
MAHDDDLPDLEDLDPEIRARLDEVQAQLSALENDLGELIGAELSAARQAFELAVSEPDNRDRHIASLTAAVHDIKGVAGSFGYGLVSDIAANLHQFLKRSGSGDARVLPVVEAHLQAFDEIRGQNLKGDGGDLGQRLLADLRALV